MNATIQVLISNATCPSFVNHTHSTTPTYQHPPSTYLWNILASRSFHGVTWTSIAGSNQGLRDAVPKKQHIDVSHCSHVLAQLLLVLLPQLQLRTRPRAISRARRWLVGYFCVAYLPQRWNSVRVVCSEQALSVGSVRRLRLHAGKQAQH
jgi:hypothetical protein